MIPEKSVESYFERNLEAHRQGFLPPEYNLRFTAADLMFVVVEDAKDKATVRDFVSGNACLVSVEEIDSKILTFEELACIGE